MPTDPADALHRLADDLEAEALDGDPTDDREAGVFEGLGRAVGKARERAERLDPEAE